MNRRSPNFGNPVILSNKTRGDRGLQRLRGEREAGTWRPPSPAGVLRPAETAGSRRGWCGEGDRDAQRRTLNAERKQAA